MNVRNGVDGIVCTGSDAIPFPAHEWHQAHPTPDIKCGQDISDASPVERLQSSKGSRPFLYVCTLFLSLFFLFFASLLLFLSFKQQDDNFVTKTDAREAYAVRGNAPRPNRAWCTAGSRTNAKKSDVTPPLSRSQIIWLCRRSQILFLFLTRVLTRARYG